MVILPASDTSPLTEFKVKSRSSVPAGTPEAALTKIFLLVEISSAALISIKRFKGVDSVVAVSELIFEAWKNPIVEVIDAFKTEGEEATVILGAIAYPDPGLVIV